MVRIAYSLDPPVTPTAVSLVFHGKSKSARISAAIERELARLKAKPTGAEAA